MLADRQRLHRGRFASLSHIPAVSLRMLLHYVQCRSLQQVGERVFVAIVALVIIADAVTGIVWLLPNICSGAGLRLQQIVGSWAAANVMINFATCVMGSPGEANVLLDISIRLGCTTYARRFSHNFCICRISSSVYQAEVSDSNCVTRTA